jgi:hypothetical protein
MSKIPDESRVLVGTRDGNRCQRCGVPCAPHWHHRRSRSVHDDHTHCSCNGVLLCPECHGWVHAHPQMARETGFIVSRSASFPGLIPYKSPWGMLTPNCTGGFSAR